MALPNANIRLFPRIRTKTTAQDNSFTQITHLPCLRTLFLIPCILLGGGRLIVCYFKAQEVFSATKLFSRRAVGGKALPVSAEEPESHPELQGQLQKQEAAQGHPKTFCFVRPRRGTWVDRSVGCGTMASLTDAGLPQRFWIPSWLLCARLSFWDTATCIFVFPRIPPVSCWLMLLPFSLPQPLSLRHLVS